MQELCCWKRVAASLPSLVPLLHWGRWGWGSEDGGAGFEERELRDCWDEVGWGKGPVCNGGL